MKFNQILSLTLFITACGTKDVEKNVSTIDKVDRNLNESLYVDNVETYNNEIDTFFIVVADTGNEYYKLRNQMLLFSKKTNLAIDTLGRYYNKSKNLIMLPENDEDDIYRGDYFPRRFPSNNLSLEYLALYSPISAEKTIAFVVGIYETKYSADSARLSILTIQPKTFVLKSGIYTGCMH